MICFVFYFQPNALNVTSCPDGLQSRLYVCVFRSEPETLSGVRTRFSSAGVFRHTGSVMIVRTKITKSRVGIGRRLRWFADGRFFPTRVILQLQKRKKKNYNTSFLTSGK